VNFEVQKPSERATEPFLGNLNNNLANELSNCCMDCIRGYSTGVYLETDMLSILRRSSNMRYSKLAMFNFMALCCVLGIFCKKIINPFANVITESLHIPGGISTGFSIMFLVIATEIVRSQCDLAKEFIFSWSGTLMGTVQGFVSLALGRVGSMGILMPLGFIASGMAIDVVYALQKFIKLNCLERMVFANALAAVTASVTANIIVFRLWGPVLWLYLGVSAISGTIFGSLGAVVAHRLRQMRIGFLK